MTEDSYKLPLKGLAGGLSMEHHLYDLVGLRAFLVSINIQTKNTRIERYELYLRAMLRQDEADMDQIFHGIDGQPFDNPTDRFLYLLREIHELAWIFKGVSASPPIGLGRKLQEIVGGQDFAVLDKNTSSRNTQFELRMASYFCQAGFGVNLESETDIIAESQRGILFLECKRVSSPKQFSKNLASARDQLKKRMPRRLRRKRCYGVIAADVTKVAFSHNGLTVAKTNEHSRDIIQDKLREISKGIDESRYFDRSRDIVAVWLQIHIPSLIQFPPQPVTRVSSMTLVNAYSNLPKGRGLKLLQSAYDTTLVEDERADAPIDLKLRKNVTIEAGTEIDWDEELLLEISNKGILEPREDDSVVCSFPYNGIDLQFFYIELVDELARLSVSERDELVFDYSRLPFEMAARLFMARYPYEEQEIF